MKTNVGLPANSSDSSPALKTSRQQKQFLYCFVSSNKGAKGIMR